MEEIDQAGARQLIGYVAEHLLDRRCLIGDRPEVVEYHDHVGRLLDQRGETPLGLLLVQVRRELGCL